MGTQAAQAPMVMPIHGDDMVVGGGSPTKARGQREGVTLNPFSDKKMVLNLVQPNTNHLHGDNSDLLPGEKEALKCLVFRLGDVVSH